MMSLTTSSGLLELVRAFLGRAGVRPATAAERAAWERFFDTYQRLLVEFVREQAKPYGFSEHAQEDLVQEVWRRVLRSLPEFDYRREVGKFRGWLNRAVEREMIDAVRRRGGRGKKRPATLEMDSDGLSRLPDRLAADPAEGLGREFELARLKVLLRQLPEMCSARDFEIFQAIQGAGRSYREVARELGMKEPTVRQAYKRVVDRLTALNKELFGTD